MKVLVRHFLDNLIGRGLFRDEGIEGLRRVFISAFAGLTILGFYLPRFFRKKYLDLSAFSDSEPYRRAIVADELFMLAALMLLAALVAALIAPAIFPDETDYVALAPLPVTRRQIFGAKLVALVVFAGAFITAMTLILSVAFPVFTHSQWSEFSLPRRVGGHGLASAAAAAAAFVLVTAIQGLISVGLPRRYVHQTSTIVQAAAIAGLILSVPLIFQLPAEGAWLRSRPAALVAFPPAWLLGFEHVLAGDQDPYFARLATTGALIMTAAIGIGVLSYWRLYVRFEEVVLPPVARPEAGSLGSKTTRGLTRFPPVWQFVIATLVRDRLAQMAFVVMWAAGGALVLNGVIGASSSRELGESAVAAPLVLMLAGTVGLRAAYRIPVNPRADWVFRLTESPGRRASHLADVRQSFIVLAVVPALVISAPLQIQALGIPRAFISLTMAAAIGLLMVEWVAVRWRRLPFTGSWVPGKRPLPFTLLYGGLVYFAFTGIGAGIIWISILKPRVALFVLGVVAVVMFLARYRRRRAWADAPIEFEDESPDRLQVLGLGPS